MLFNKDIMAFESFPEYDIIWTDPPWGDRMVKYFETMMHKNGQPRPRHTIEQIMNQLAKLASSEKPLFIEYSAAGCEDVIFLIENHGHMHSATVDSVQTNGNNYVALSFNTDFVPNGRCRGFEIIDDVSSRLEFRTVFDPFAGTGRTARAFIANGKSYIGSEINTSRFNQLKKVWDAQQ